MCTRVRLKELTSDKLNGAKTVCMVQIQIAYFTRIYEAARQKTCMVTELFIFR
jgi:hypothetical protein